MTDGETKRIASAAAKEALEHFLLMMGVDISTPAGILDLQQDFHHIRAARKMVGQARNKVVDVLTGAAASGVIAALTFYFTHKG